MTAEADSTPGRVARRRTAGWGWLREREHVLPYLALTLLCAVLYLPGITSIPPIDPDEARSALATREMIEGGNLIGVPATGETAPARPVGIHWLQALSVGLLSDARRPVIWPYRVPSVLGAWTAVLLTYGLGRGLSGRRVALLAAAMLAAALGVVAAAHQATAGAPLLSAIVAAQLILAQTYRRWREGIAEEPGWKTIIAFWSALGTGFLLQGPASPGVTALTAIVLAVAHRNLRWLLALRPLPGLIIALAIVLPWWAAVTFADGIAPLQATSLLDGLAALSAGPLSPAVTGDSSLLTVLVSFWPASVFLLPAVVSAWTARREATAAFALAWALPTWLVLELVPNGLPHLLLPVLPALALLAARVATTTGGAAALAAWPGLLYLVAWVAVLGATGLALIAIPLYLGIGVAGWTIGPTVVLLATTLSAAWLASRQVPAKAWAAGLTGAVLFVPWLSAGYLPRLTPLWLSQDTARAVESLRRYPGESVAVSGYTAPSLGFLLGVHTRLTDPEGVARHLMAGPSRLAVVSEPDRLAFEAALEVQDLAARSVATVTGFDYAQEGWITLHVYHRDR